MTETRQPLYPSAERPLVFADPTSGERFPVQPHQPEVSTYNTPTLGTAEALAAEARHHAAQARPETQPEAVQSPELSQEQLLEFMLAVDSMLEANRYEELTGARG